MNFSIKDVDQELSKKIRLKISNNEADLIKFLQKLIRTPSVNGVHPEETIAKLVYQKAQLLRLPVKLLWKDPKRPNVFIGRHFSSKKTLLFTAHLDTVPAGNQNEWKYPAFIPKISKGRLYGRGAIDCKAGIALSVYALKILNDVGYPSAAVFTGTADEESGADSDLGLKYLIKKGIRAAAAIYTYPGHETISIGHRGLVRAWINCTGKSVHTGSSRWMKRTLGASAIEALLGYLEEINKISFYDSHPAFPDYSFTQTITMIEGGSGESIVPNRAKALIDARLLPNQNNQTYIKRLRITARKYCRNGTRCQVVIKNNFPGSAISKDEKVVKILEKLTKEILKDSPKIEGRGPGNESYLLNRRGIPTIGGFGIGGDGSHAANEYANLNDIQKILEIYVKAAITMQ